MRMTTHLIQIGNSRGIRLTKAVLDEAALSDEVELDVEPGRIVIRSALGPRAGWAESIERLGPSPLLDAPTATHFDEEEWTW